MQMYNNSLKYIDHITIIYDDDDDGDKKKISCASYVHEQTNKQKNLLLFIYRLIDYY